MYTGWGEKNHLKLQVEKKNMTFTCVAFKMGELFDRLQPGVIADIAFTPEINVYGGRESLQLRIADIIIN